MPDIRNNELVFKFPDTHANAELSITFMRTLRLPDDGKNYPLPPGLGSFPIVSVDDHKSTPEKWKKRGGVMIPMYQSEALWIHFKSNMIYDHEHAYPFAIKIAAGKRSAVTGDAWSKELKKGDYVVSPEQPWIDGFVVDGGLVRQFVAVPLGSGLTVERQLTKKEEFGGIQIQVFPMKRSAFESRWPKKVVNFYHSLTRGIGNIGFGGGTQTQSLYAAQSAGSLSLNCYSGQINEIGEDPFNAVMCSAVADMGLGAGGMMKQQIFADPYSLKDWNQSVKSRCYAHIVNSLTWRRITNQDPPTAPRTAAEYSQHGLPWFDYYRDDLESLEATKALKTIKSVQTIATKKKMNILPENESVNPKNVIQVPGSKGKIRDGRWA